MGAPTVEHVIYKKLKEMTDKGIGTKKKEMELQLKREYLKEGHTESDWARDKFKVMQKNNYTRSWNSHKTLKERASVFLNYCQEQGVKKFRDANNKEFLEGFLKSRELEGKSVYTLNTDMYFINKTFGETANFTKKELGFPERTSDDTRKGHKPSSAFYEEKYKDAITIIKSCGARRENVLKLQKEDFILNGAGEPIQVSIKKSKGGKNYTAYILPKYREQLKEIISNAPEDKPIIENLSKRVQAHYYRSCYAKDIINQLDHEEKHNLPYFKGEIDYEIKISDHDNKRYEDGFKGYSKEICNLASQQIAHNRTEILKHYI